MKKNMAKHIHLFFLAFLAMILCSCQGLPHDGIGSTTEIIEVDIAPYFSRDWDAFLADLENVQKTDQKEHFLWLEDKEEGIVLPILQSDDYSLLAVEVYPSWFEFFYMPYDSEERFFQSDVGFWIQVRRTPDDFLNGLERYQEEITVIDENTYYCPKDNRWDFLYGENSVLIVCPESVVLDRPEQLEEYFVFERFTFGDAEHELPEGDDRPILTLESGDAYTKFLNSVEMPADFVSYDKIDAIGAFKGLVFLSDAYTNDYSSYMYSLVDSEGFEINLYVDHRDEVLSTANSVSKVNKTNMRLLSDTSSGVYVSDNIKYQYVSGELLSISWETQNVNYTLCGSMFLSDYPLTSSTLVGKMLNSNTAPQAINTVFDVTSK